MKKAKRNVTKKGSLVFNCYNAEKGTWHSDAMVGSALWLVKSVLKDGTIKVAGHPHPMKSWVCWNGQ